LKYGVTWWNYVGQPVHYVVLALERAYGSEENIIRNVAQNPRKKLRVAFGNGSSWIDQEKFIKYFGLENMMESYGSTEMAIAVMGHKDNPRGSVGLVIDPDVKIYNERGKECPPAEYDGKGKFLNYTEAVGEIVREGGALPEFEGYYELPEEDQRKIRGGVYHSGDLGHIRILDGNRYLYFDGRTDDWIRKDGENFSAENVAQSIAGFPAFELVAAYGVPCPVSDEWVMTAAKLRTGHTFDAGEFHEYVERQCRSGSMDRKWKPDFVRIVDEFEFTRTEKILVRPLKHEFYNLEWAPEGSIYFFRRGFETYKLFTKEEMEKLRVEFKETGKEQLLDAWR
jgi:fatty-acyl-CoA synthase